MSIERVRDWCKQQLDLRLDLMAGLNDDILARNRLIVRDGPADAPFALRRLRPHRQRDKRQGHCKECFVHEVPRASPTWQPRPVRPIAPDERTGCGKVAENQ